ncbi:MAG: ice-binding family protein [Myxococcota bacterium]|nr:ice-binding family protein [Myxococcota bacterium]
MNKKSCLQAVVGVVLSLGIAAGCGDNIVPGGEDTSVPPVAVDDAVIAYEGVASSFDVLANDTDTDGGPKLVTATTQPTNGMVGINANGTLAYESDPDFIGTDTFSYTLNGGAVAEVTVDVRATNDAPSFTVGANQTVLEDAGPQVVMPWATMISAGPADEATQVLTFEVTTNTNPDLFSAGPAITPAGDLTYTPAANAVGAATITVRLSDAGGTAQGGVDTSAPQTFTITVTPVNDAPAFLVGPDQVVAQDPGAQTVDPWATMISAGPADESAQLLTFEVTANTNPGLFMVAPAVSPMGVLTYTPTMGAVGTALITLRVTDDGGVANGGVRASANQSFLITVGPALPNPNGINLRSLSTFVAVAGAGLTSSNSSGVTTLGGNVGLYPTATCMSDGSICSSGNPTITGTLYAADPEGVAAQAKVDLTAAYVEAMARPPGTTVNDISGMVLAPGVYTSGSTMSIAVGGVVTLDAQGDGNAVWIFQIGSSLTVNNNAQVLLVNGAVPGNVYWAAGASSTLGADVSFQGTVMAQASNSVGTDSVVVGRLLSTDGMITLLSNTITLP